MTHAAFTGRFVHPVTTTDGHRVGARIGWPAAITALDRGELPCTDSEAHMLPIAAPLAASTRSS